MRIIYWNKLHLSWVINIHARIAFDHARPFLFLSETTLSDTRFTFQYDRVPFSSQFNRAPSRSRHVSNCGAPVSLDAFFLYRSKIDRIVEIVNNLKDKLERLANNIQAYARVFRFCGCILVTRFRCGIDNDNEVASVRIRCSKLMILLEELCET